MFRTALHGTCLLKGRHEPGSQLERECPLLRRQRRALQGGEGVDSGARKMAADPASILETSNTVLRYGRAFRPGRPRVPAAEQRQRTRDRVRAYRARQRRGTA
jgi:hypothetical protein